MTEKQIIDLNWRPDTYWPESSTPEQLLSRIHGKARQDIARQIFNEEGFPGLTAFIAREELGEEDKYIWGGFHPMFMGGEYLPSLEIGEVEIVRISLASTTVDQISIRAKCEDGKIKYRVVGEYEDEEGMHYKQPFSESDEPLSLRDLVMLMDGSYIPSDNFSGGLVKANWNAVYADDCDVDEAISFVSISSPFYPELEAYYDMVAKSWCGERRITDEDEDEDEDE